MEEVALHAIEQVLPQRRRLHPERPQLPTTRAHEITAVHERESVFYLGGPIRLRLYWPRGAGTVPAIVYYHGGGHVIGSLDTHDFVARNLCAGAACDRKNRLRIGVSMPVTRLSCLVGQAPLPQPSRRC